MPEFLQTVLLVLLLVGIVLVLDRPPPEDAPDLRALRSRVKPIERKKW